LVVDWGGKVAAWFAAVTAGSAALAALIIATPHAAPLHGWLHAAFIALLVIGSVSFLFLMLTGPPALLAAWRAHRAGLLAERGSPALEPPAFPPLEFRLYTGKPPPEYGDWITRHYLEIENPPGQPERRVYVTQEGIKPEPRHLYPYSPRPAFPYPVPPKGGGHAAAGIPVQPGQKESWFIGDAATGSDGKMNLSEFNVTRNAHLAWQIDPDEDLRFIYRIRCEGVAAEKEFSVRVYSEDGKTIKVEPG
jgi:hypothetical protein